MKNFIRAICISEREGFNQIKKGKAYLIETNSLIVDIDGDAYANIYTEDKQHIANMLLKHFTTM